MSLLSQVTTGKRKMPLLMMLYAIDGIGKSTFGAKADKPIFLGPERGTDNLDVARFPSLESWDQTFEAIKELKTTKHGYETLVIDSIDWLEKLLHKSITDHYGKPMAQAAGGYGAAYKEAESKWYKLTEALYDLREATKMNIILIAHSHVTEFNDPSTEKPYNRYELKLHNQKNTDIPGLFREFVDILAFANYETATTGEGKNVRGITERKRKIYFERDAAFDAKNRFGLPFEMEFTFDCYRQIKQFVDGTGASELDVLRKEIEELAEAIGDGDTKKKVLATLAKADNKTKLNHLKKKVHTATGKAA